MCGGAGGSVCKKPAGEQGKVSSILQTPGSTSSTATIQADRVISNCLAHVHSAIQSLPLCIVTCAHHEKWYFPRACSEAVHGSAVTGVTFLLPGGDSLDSAALLVWGLWCFLKGVLCLIALHTLHHGCFASFLTDWLAPQFTGLPLSWSLLWNQDFLCGTFPTIVDNNSLFCSFGGYGTAHIFDCVIAYTVT